MFGLLAAIARSRGHVMKENNCPCQAFFDSQQQIDCNLNIIFYYISIETNESQRAKEIVQPFTGNVDVSI
jgi:hypothetical protein